MKKVWIAIAGTIAALCVVLLVISLASPKQTLESGDEDSSYPYSYEKTKDGLVIHITGSFPEGYRWIASGSGAVTVTEQKQTAKKADFLLSPAGVGGADVLFDLQRDTDGLNEQTYRITVELVAALDGSLSVLRNSHSEQSGIVTEAGEGFSYRAAPQSDGTLAVVLDNADGNTWAAETDGDAVFTYLNEEADGLLRYTVGYQALGQSTVYLCCEETGQAVKLYVTTDLMQQVRLVESAIIAHEYAEHTSPDTLFAGLFGEIPLPAEAKEITREITEWVSRADNVTRLRTGLLHFSLDGVDWELYAARQGSTQDFIASCAKSHNEQRELTVGTAHAEAYLYDGGGASAWTDDDGQHYMLRGRNVSMDELAAAAEKIMEAMNVG